MRQTTPAYRRAKTRAAASGSTPSFKRTIVCPIGQIRFSFSPPPRAAGASKARRSANSRPARERGALVDIELGLALRDRAGLRRARRRAGALAERRRVEQLL